jgi:WD40 repeat protein
MKLNTLLLAILFLVISGTAFGQSISIFDIDTTNFPTMKAKFYAFDKDGNQVRPSASELSITEDGVPRKITNVSCQPPRRIKLSVGIMVDTYKYLDLARSGTERLINFLDMPNEDELALTYMNGRASIWQDFTKNKTIAIDKAKTIPVAPGVDINTMFYSDISGGVPLIKDRKTDKKVLILVSDLHCPNLNINEAKLIADAKTYNISIYTVLLGTTDYSGLFTRIAAGSGGTIFENVRNETEITNVFEKISQIENNEPCEISWESRIQCFSKYINVELNLKSLKSNSTYNQSTKAIASLMVNPSFISFGKISKPLIIDTTVTLTAINSDITINDIKLKYGSSIFEITNTTYPIIIQQNSSKTISLKCTPIDSNINYAFFEIETNLCPFNISTYSGFNDKNNNTNTLKLTHPNGKEIFDAGSDSMITWEGISPIDTCLLEFSNDNGITWKTLTNKANNLKYNWKNIPIPQNNKSLIKITQINQNSDIDSLALSKPSLTLNLNMEVRRINWHPNINFIAIADLNNLVIYDANIGQSIKTLTGHSEEITSVSWNHNGNLIATSSTDKTSKIWDVKSGKLIFTLVGHTNIVSMASWSPDGNKLATASYDGTCMVWNTNTGKLIFTLTGHNDIVRRINWSPDGNKLATASTDGTSKIWDANLGQLLFDLINHNSDVYQLNWSPDGSKLATATVEGIGRIWDTKTGLLLNTLLGHTKDISQIVWSPDGSKLATSSFDNTCKIWNSNSGQLINTLNSQQLNVYNISWSPNGKFLASCGQGAAGKVWNSNSGTLLATLNGHINYIYNISWNNDGHKIATSSKDGTCKIWDLGNDIIQSDQSDAVFSIIAPEPQFQQLNIDMGQVVVGSSKDTMVTTVLCNVGQAPLHVLGVDVTNGNTNEFMVPRGAGDFFLTPSECRDMMFAFMPSQVGVRNAKITVKSTIGDYIDTINIIGTGIQPTIQIVNNLIDFGKIKVGNRKDTNQVITIKNISNAPLSISKIYQDGPNTLDFKDLSNLTNTTLQPNEELKLNLRFSPNEIGRTSGTLMFEHNGVGSPAVVQLFGEGIQPIAQVINNIIDFGQVQIGNEKDTIQALTIMNSGNAPLSILNIYQNGSNTLDFAELNNLNNTTLQPNEELKLDLRFKPSFVGISKDSIIFEHDGIGSPTAVELIGEGISSGSGGGKASLKLDSIETKTSSLVEYPVKLTLDSKVLKSGANAVNFDITYNNTLLYPMETYPITNRDDLATLSFKNVPLTTDPIQILDTLKFRTGLGNAIETPLTISNFELLGTTEDIEVIPNHGNLKLTDVCFDGGVRLLNPNSVVSIANISPNPVNSIISIDLNLIEIGNTEVSIYNLLGEKVKTIFSKDITETGNITINSEISDLSNGQYVVIFKTPTYLEKNNILLIK